VPGVARVDSYRTLSQSDTVRDTVARRWLHMFPSSDLAPTLLITLTPYSVWGNSASAEHGSPYDYDADVPILFRGASVPSWHVCDSGAGDGHGANACRRVERAANRASGRTRAARGAHGDDDNGSRSIRKAQPLIEGNRATLRARRLSRNASAGSTVQVVMRATCVHHDALDAGRHRVSRGIHCDRSLAAAVTSGAALQLCCRFSPRKGETRGSFSCNEHDTRSLSHPIPAFVGAAVSRDNGA
jgi:hypothetical protein